MLVETKGIVMNEVLMRMRSRNKNMQNTSMYPHLNVLMELMSQFSEPKINLDELSVIGSLNIKFAEAGKRMRKIVRRSNSRMTGKFPSTKNGRLMHWESRYELETFQILEISPLVATYSEQPAKFKYVNFDGIPRIHFPDILVTLTCGVRFFIEVKPQSEVSNQLLAERTTLLARLIEPMGYGYILILPEQVSSLAYLENAKELLRFCKLPMPESVWETVRRLFVTESSIQLSILISLIGHTNAKSWIYRLLISGDLQSNLSVPITQKTLLRWNHEETT